jgi:hypothetical protein
MQLIKPIKAIIDPKKIRKPKFDTKRGPLSDRTMVRRASSPFLGTPKSLKGFAMTDAIRKNSSTKVLLASVLEKTLLDYKHKRMVENMDITATQVASRNMISRQNKTSLANKAKSNIPNMKPRSPIAQPMKAPGQPSTTVIPVQKTTWGSK